MPTIRFKLGAYEDRRYKVAMSLPELTQQTNSFSTKNEPGCQPSLLNSDPRNLRLHYNVKCNLKESDPAGHDVKVQFDIDHITEATKSKDLDVEASCTCPAFLYWGGQWNMHQRDALEGEPRPLLTAPTERLDLRNHFLICKHIKRVMDRILPSVQHNIVKIIRQRTVDKYKDEHPEEPKATKPAPKKPRGKTPGAPPKPTPKSPVVERTKPATPEERERTPVLTEKMPSVTGPVEKVPTLPAAPEPTPPPPPPPPPVPDEAPASAALAPPPPAAPRPPSLRPVRPVPTIDELDEEPRKPAKIEPITDKDRKFMQRLEDGEMRRQEKKK